MSIFEEYGAFNLNALNTITADKPLTFNYWRKYGLTFHVNCLYRRRT